MCSSNEVYPFVEQMKSKSRVESYCIAVYTRSIDLVRSKSGVGNGRNVIRLVAQYSHQTGPFVDHGIGRIGSLDGDCSLETLRNTSV